MKGIEIVFVEEFKLIFGIVNFVNSVKEEIGFDGLIYKRKNNKKLDISVWNLVSDFASAR